MIEVTVVTVMTVMTIATVVTVVTKVTVETIVKVVTVVTRKEKKNFFFTNFFPNKKSLKNSKNEIVVKLKNSNCDENQKLKL